jgi:hypothetical protein
MSRVVMVLAFVACALIGAAMGLGLFTFWYAKGASYLGNDPETCANCHVMRDTSTPGARAATTRWPPATTATRRRAAWPSTG